MSDIIDQIIISEGGDRITNDSLDSGGLTKFGISQRANPGVDIVNLTYEQARVIYEKKYISSIHFDRIGDRQLRDQLIDYGVNSGPSIAIMKLQEIVGVKVDGIVGPKTLAAVASLVSADISRALVAKRILMMGHIVHDKPSQVKYINGWLARALDFLI